MQGDGWVQVGSLAMLGSCAKLMGRLHECHACAASLAASQNLLLHLPAAPKQACGGCQAQRAAVGVPCAGAVCDG